MYLAPWAQFTRPANTTQYGGNQLVGNSTAAGSVVPLAFNFAIINGRGRLFHARIWKSTNATTSAKFNLHLYTQIPVPVNGDGGNYSVATTRWWFTTIAMDMTAGTENVGANVTSIDLSEQYAAPVGQGMCFDCWASGSLDGLPVPMPIPSLFGLIETQTGATYTPGSGEIFKIELGVEGFSI